VAFLQPAELPGAPPSVAAAELIVAGSALQFAGACAEAIPLFEQAIAIDPNFANVYALLGLCYYEQGHLDAAIIRWEEALRRDPLSPDALAGLGTALYRQGQHEAGLELYRQAVAVDPGFGNETYLRVERFWSGPAIFDSRVLRAVLAP
jgi:tetratricopeptide (TPR) repeat protein